MQVASSVSGRALVSMLVGWVVVSQVLTGCDPAPTGRCASARDCGAAMECFDGRCVVGRDVGTPPLDIGVRDAPCVCGAGQSCATGTCVADCGDPRATACATGNTCDYAPAITAP